MDTLTKHLVGLGAVAWLWGQTAVAATLLVTFEAPETQLSNGKHFDGVGDFIAGPFFQRAITPPDMVLCLVTPAVAEHLCWTDTTVARKPQQTADKLDGAIDDLEQWLEVRPAWLQELRSKAKSAGEWVDEELDDRPSLSLCVDSYTCQWEVPLLQPPFALYVYDDDTDSTVGRLVTSKESRFTELIDILLITGEEPNTTMVNALRNRLVYEVAGHGDEDLLQGYQYRSNKTRHRVRQMKTLESVEECRLRCPAGQSMVTLIAETPEIQENYDD